MNGSKHDTEAADAGILRMNLAQETLGFRRLEFQSNFSLLVPAFSLPQADTAPYGTACISCGTLPYRACAPVASAPCLVPIIIGAHFLDQ